MSHGIPIIVRIIYTSGVTKTTRTIDKIRVLDPIDV
jgi:hypothetical protein